MVRFQTIAKNIQEDLFNNDVLNAVAAADGRANNYNNKLRSNFVATRGSGANAFTNQANGLGVLENAGANWDNYRSEQEIVNGPRRSVSSSNNYRARPTGDYQAQVHASQDLTDYLVNRYNKYDLLPQFRRGDVFDQKGTGYIPGVAHDDVTGMHKYYNTVVDEADKQHSWKHVFDDVTNLGINAAAGENMAEKGSLAQQEIAKIFEALGQGDPELLEAIKKDPSLRSRIMMGGMLHDIGNYGVKGLDGLARDLHNATGAGILRGNLPGAEATDEEVKNWVRKFAPEAYINYLVGTEKKSLTPSDISKNLANIREVLAKGQSLANDAVNGAGKMNANRLENILNQSGYNENARSNLNDIIESVERHRNSASEVYNKITEDRKFNPYLGNPDDNEAFAKTIKKYALPRNIMDKTVAFADKVGDEFTGADVSRAAAYASQDKTIKKSPGTAGNILAALLDAIDYKANVVDDLSKHKSYSNWGKDILQSYGNKKSDIFKRLDPSYKGTYDKNNKDDQDYAINEVMEALRRIGQKGSLRDRKYFNKPEDRMQRAEEQLDSILGYPDKEALLRELLGKLVKVNTNGKINYINPISNQPLNPYERGGGKNFDYRDLIRDLANDPRYSKLFNEVPATMDYFDQV